jgi:hypothetical protein
MTTSFRIPSTCWAYQSGNVSLSPAVTSLLTTDWYARQMVRAPVSDYDEARGPAMDGDGWPARRD